MIWIDSSVVRLKILLSMNQFFTVHIDFIWVKRKERTVIQKVNNINVKRSISYIKYYATKTVGIKSKLGQSEQGKKNKKKKLGQQKNKSRSVIKLGQ